MSAAFARVSAGLEKPVLVFALRTAFAACAALLIGWLAGLEHPQWAAMTVWASSQPTRGQLIEKGFYRFGGTVVGVLAGVALVKLSGGAPLFLVIGLAVWIALCTGIGHLLRGFSVYGAILSGYSASMVALLDTGHPDHVVHLGVDRFLTIGLGVVVAVIVGLLLTPKEEPGALTHAIRLATSRMLRLMAREGEIRGDTRRLLADIAGIEERLEPHGAGSLKARGFVRAARVLFMAEVETLLWLRAGLTAAITPEARGALEAAAAALESGQSPAAMLAALDRADETLEGQGEPHAHLFRLRTAFAAFIGGPGPDERSGATGAPPVILHTDWRGARSAALRAFTVMLGIGLVWVVTGIAVGPYLLLGLSIMISLFSTFENPARLLPNVALGQLAGVSGALVCRWLVWPHLGDHPLALVFAVMPFILFGALLMAHKRSRPAAFDYNMVLLLLLQPVLPLHGDLAHWLAMGAAVVAAPLVALVAYRLWPVDAARREAMLTRAMLAELKDMAASGKPLRPKVWRARLHHRLLRLAQLGEKSGLGGTVAVERGFAIYGLGEIVLTMREWQERDGRLDRSLRLALARIAAVEREPEPLARALSTAAERLERQGVPEAAEFRAAAAALRRNGAFPIVFGG